MIAPWLVYAVMIATLLGFAAVGVDRIGQWRGWSLRWIWLSALVASVAAPIVGNFLATPKTVTASTVATLASSSTPFPLNAVLVVIWGIASLVLIVRLITALLLLQRTRRNWLETTIDGTPVLLTRDVGPALIGFTKPRPVIPAWAFNLGVSERTMILRHEAEHARAGDPLLLAVATLGVAAMPWNPVLWWFSRRLRLAVEMDCDRRVVKSGADPHAYATLLVAVGERVSRTPFAWATALATPPSFLQRRIIAMLTPSLPRKPMLAISGISIAAVAAIVVACSTTLPEPIVSSPTEMREDFPTWYAREVVLDSLSMENMQHLQNFLSNHVTEDSLTRMHEVPSLELFVVRPDSEHKPLPPGYDWEAGIEKPVEQVSLPLRLELDVHHPKKRP